MTPSFNLLTQPWIPCILEGNRSVQLSLLGTVAKAHQIKRIQTDLPIMTGSLYLFLLAFVMSVLRPKEEIDWKAIWESGKFPEEKVLDYAKTWENRFDLFDPIHPFYQDPLFGKREKDLKNLPKGQTPSQKPLSGFLLHLASGSQATLFDHSLDEQPQEYSLTEAVQLLIMLQAYSLGGMSLASISKDKYYKDAPFGRGITFINWGINLFETLLLNLPTEDFGPYRHHENDKPAWEVEDSHSEERFAPNGLMDLLTWQSRRFLLIPEENTKGVFIQQVFSAPGFGIVETYSNPLYQTKIVEKRTKTTISPLRFQTGRTLWRDSSAILGFRSDNKRPPLPIYWANRLISANFITKKKIFLDLYGMCTEPGKQKAYTYAQETFSAPSQYLSDPDLLSDLDRNLDIAEQVKQALRTSLWVMACLVIAPNSDLEAEHHPSGNDTGPMIIHWNADEVYWSRLEPAFYELLFALPLDADQAYAQWEQALGNAAWEALKFAESQVGTDTAGLKACAKAENTLGYKIKQIFSSSEEE